MHRMMKLIQREREEGDLDAAGLHELPAGNGVQEGAIVAELEGDGAQNDEVNPERAREEGDLDAAGHPELLAENGIQDGENLLEDACEIPEREREGGVRNLFTYHKVIKKDRLSLIIKPFLHYFLVCGRQVPHKKNLHRNGKVEFCVICQSFLFVQPIRSLT